MNQTPTLAEMYALVNKMKADHEAQMALLKAENEALRQSKERALSCKVSEKGAVSVYGLNRQFPVTLYARQWEKVSTFMPTIMAFIKANEASLKRKAAEAKIALAEQE